MKKTICFLGVLALCALSYAQIPVDSISVFSKNDTSFYLGIYGVFMACPAELTNSSITISNDTIVVHVCYNDGSSSGDFCKVSDTLFLGNLHLTMLYVTVYLSKANFVTHNCNTTPFIDTVNLWHMITSFYKVSKNELSLYPNPATNRLQIQSGGLPVSGVNIYNSSGQLVMQQNNALQSVDIAPLPRGLYIAEVITPQGNMRKRWVKE